MGSKVTTGLDRLFGPSSQGRINELRRAANVALSDASEEITDSGTYPRLVTVIRRQQLAPENSSTGKAA